MRLAEHQDLLGQGPNAHVVHHRRQPIDHWLPTFGDWLEHDGKGLPDFLIGRRVRVSGLDHKRCHALSSLSIVAITLDYVASEDAAIWDWSRGFGGVSAYRIERREPLPLCDEAIHILDLLRGGMGRNGSNPLMLGMDGVLE